MITRRLVPWLSKSEIAALLGLGTGTVGEKLAGMYIPMEEKDGTCYYRMLDVLQVLAPGEFCPVCLEKIQFRTDKIFCDKKCRAKAANALEDTYGVLSLGVPPVAVPMSGYMMRKVRQVALDINGTMANATRLLISEGCAKRDVDSAV